MDEMFVPWQKLLDDVGPTFHGTISTKALTNASVSYMEVVVVTETDLELCKNVKRNVMFVPCQKLLGHVGLAFQGAITTKTLANANFSSMEVVVVTETDLVPCKNVKRNVVRYK